MANIKTMVWKTSNVSILTAVNIAAVGGYRLAQKLKLNGVMNMAATVEIAVRLTERATFPRAREVMKLETLPPGQAATIIIPIAILGRGSITSTNRKVSKGRTRNCETTPTMAGFGTLVRRRKSANLKSKATPNMITAKQRLSAQSDSLLKLSCTASMVSGR